MKNQIKMTIGISHLNLKKLEAGIENKKIAKQMVMDGKQGLKI